MKRRPAGPSVAVQTASHAQGLRRIDIADDRMDLNCHNQSMAAILYSAILPRTIERLETER